jgi:L-threonylcarbamoyladenylate synthase
MIIETKEAIKLLREGKCVVVPTETVYGLGADATNDMAVAQIYAIKHRPNFNPLIIHIDSIKQAQRFAQIHGRAQKLAQIFWENHQGEGQKNHPLTMVVPIANDGFISPLATAGLKTVAIRKPNHPIILEILYCLDFPLAIPSANLSTYLSPTTADQVEKNLGPDIDIVNGGPSQVGIESTIIDLSQDVPTILRSGAVTKEALEDALGETIKPHHDKKSIIAPGMMQRHYAPSIPMRMNALNVSDEKEILIGFGPTDLKVFDNLSVCGNLMEAAARLYATLDRASASGASSIAVMPIPNIGIGIAINDRLKRGSLS